MKEVIYYDITRLLHRSRADTPTGIDRVDINYAYYFLNNDKYDLKCIFQEKSIFFLADAKLFIEMLYKKWISIDSYNFDFNTYFQKNINRTKTKSKVLQKYHPHSKTKYFQHVDGDLIDSLLRTSYSNGIYINVSHHGIGNINAYQIFKIIGNLKFVFYLHDIIPIDYPEYVREGDDVTHAKRVTVISQYSDYVLVNSEYTKNRFKNFCLRENIRIPDIAVLQIGVEPHFFKMIHEYKDSYFSKNDINYFVYISTIEPRKNHLLLLHLWRQMVIENNSNIPKLVILGKRGWNNQNIIDLLDRSQLLKNHIIELSNLSDKQMISVLRGAKALLYPSFVEGWGMPIVEGVALGIPVVCSDIEAHRESGQGVIEYISLDDSLSWKNKILTLNSRDEARQEIISRYKNYVFPSWVDHFDNLDGILKIVFAKPKIFITLKDSSINHREDVLVNYYNHSNSDSNSDELNNHINWLERFIIYSLFGKDTERRKKLVRKFKNNPIKFMKDSKNSLIRKLGSILDAI